MILVAIDPGVHRCACARFQDGRLVDASFYSIATFKRGGPFAEWPAAELPKGIDGVVVEMPQVDGRTRTARPQDLIGLAWHGALMAGVLARSAPIFTATPSEWKGSEPKPQQHARLWEELTAEERHTLGGKPIEVAIMAARRRGALSRWSRPGVSYYPRGFAAHNLLDAVALGAWYHGRLPRL